MTKLTEFIKVCCCSWSVSKSCPCCPSSLPWCDRACCRPLISMSESAGSMLVESFHALMFCCYSCPPFFIHIFFSSLLICIIVCLSFSALVPFLPLFLPFPLCSATPPCINTPHPPPVKVVSSKIKWLCKSSRPCLIIDLVCTRWNRVIIGEVIIKGLRFGPPPRCLSAHSLKDIGRQTGPISPFASRPHRKSRWVMAPGSVISGIR